MSSDIKNVAVNSAALLVVQLANMLLPLLMIPYLTRTLGISLYGVVSFGIATAALCVTLTEYGFGLSAVQAFARESSDRIALRRRIGAVLVCKMALLLVATAVLVAFALTSNKYANHRAFLLLMLLSVAGQTLQPVWLFQGIERMVKVSIFLVAGRATYLVLTVLYVTGPEDYQAVAITFGAAHLFAAALGWSLAITQGYAPLRPSIPLLRQTFSESTPFFWSRATVAASSGGTFLLGIVSTTTQVAYFSVAEQLYRGLQALVAPITQTLYPYLARTSNFQIFFSILRMMMAAGVVLAAVGALGGRWAIELAFGGDFDGSFAVLCVFLLTFLAYIPSSMLGYPFLGGLRRVDLANRTLILAGFLHLLLLLFCLIFKAKEATTIAVVILSVELFVLSQRWWLASNVYAAYRKVS
jgi:polysaccharide transporter, PST family